MGEKNFFSQSWMKRHLTHGATVVKRKTNRLFWTDRLHSERSNSDIPVIAAIHHLQKSVSLSFFSLYVVVYGTSKAKCSKSKEGKERRPFLPPSRFLLPPSHCVLLLCLPLALALKLAFGKDRSLRLPLSLSLTSISSRCVWCAGVRDVRKSTFTGRLLVKHSSSVF